MAQEMAELLGVGALLLRAVPPQPQFGGSVALTPSRFAIVAASAEAQGEPVPSVAVRGRVAISPVACNFLPVSRV